MSRGLRVRLPEEDREKVAVLAYMGLSVEAIALAIRCHVDTLRKSCEWELNEGAKAKQAAVYLSLHGRAIDGHVAAAKACIELGQAADQAAREREFGAPAAAPAKEPAKGKKETAFDDAAGHLEDFLREPIPSDQSERPN